MFVANILHVCYNKFEGDCMSIRGDVSKKKILEAGRRLFAQRGFSAVTMQAIAEEAGISRGGLYRHYSSTDEIFTAIIQDEQQQAHMSLDTARQNGVSAKKILMHYIRSRLELISDSEKCIDNAISEFAANSESGKLLITKRAAESIEIVSEMIALGNAVGDFSCSDPDTAALVINCLLQGLSKHNALIALQTAQSDDILTMISELLHT